MASIHPFPSRQQVLQPEDLRMAADVFEAALHSVDESACAHSPYATRQILARYIIERALGGERDPVKLGEGALACLSLSGSEATAYALAHQSP
jgi:hypothetical protein